MNQYKKHIVVQPATDLKKMEPILHHWRGELKSGYYLGEWGATKYQGLFFKPSNKEWQVHQNWSGGVYRLNPLLDSLGLDEEQRANLEQLLYAGLDSTNLSFQIISTALYDKQGAAMRAAGRIRMSGKSEFKRCTAEDGVVVFHEKVSWQFLRMLRRTHPKAYKFKAGKGYLPKKLVGPAHFAVHFNNILYRFGFGDIWLEAKGEGLVAKGRSSDVIAYSAYRELQEAYPEWEIVAETRTLDDEIGQARQKIKRILAGIGHRGIDHFERRFGDIIQIARDQMRLDNHEKQKEYWTSLKK